MRLKYRINLTCQEISTLESLIQKHSTPQNRVRRARIILMANEEGMRNTQISKALGTDYSDVTKWTKRWIERSRDPVEMRLTDLPRPGSPSTITSEQWCQIMAIACEPPESHGLPITHWTHRELAQQIIKQGIVGTISTSHLGNFLKNSIYNPTAVATG